MGTNHTGTNHTTQWWIPRKDVQLLFVHGKLVDNLGKLVFRIGQTAGGIFALSPCLKKK